MRSLMIAGLAAALLTPPAPAQEAHPPTEAAVEALRQCLVGKTTGNDRLLIARWIGGAIVSAPRVADVARVDPARKDETDRQMAALFTRLITSDCRTEAMPLLIAGKTAAFAAAFESLGKIAMQELMSDPATGASIEAFVKYLKPEDFAKLGK